MASDQDQTLMREAIRLMRDAGVVNKTRGPFGAVVAKDGEVVAAAGNSVVRDLDPVLTQRSTRSGRLAKNLEPGISVVV